MLQRVNSWLLFCVMTVGVFLLMVGARPGLQATDHHGGAGPTVSIVGHSLTWTSAAVLAVRMLRSSRSGIQHEQRERELNYARATALRSSPSDQSQV